MKFNKLISVMREYCAEASTRYHTEYVRCGGYLFCGYLNLAKAL